MSTTVKKFPLSNLVNILEALGVPRSSIYNWEKVGAIEGAESVEEKGQKYLYIKDEDRFKNWLGDKLGLKGIKIIERTEQGVPFGKFLEKFEELSAEVRRLEKEVADKEASLKVIEEKLKDKESRIRELTEKNLALAQKVEGIQVELERKEKEIKELKRKLKLKEVSQELEGIIKELPEEKKKKLLKILEEVV